MHSSKLVQNTNSSVLKQLADNSDVNPNKAEAISELKATKQKLLTVMNASENIQSFSENINNNNTNQIVSPNQTTLFSQTNAETSVNLILDIPKIPFNKDQYQKALMLGRCLTYESDKGYIDIQRLHARNDIPGSGFGTAKFREIVMRSIEINSRQIITDASTSYGSPHLFYLYMGMAPKSRQCDYIETIYGLSGTEALEFFEECKELKDEELKDALTNPLPEKEFIVDDVKRTIFGEMKKMNLPINRESVIDEIIKNKNILLNLKGKTLEYVSNVFIPTLLKTLAREPTNKYPNTNLLGATQMYMTDEGLARWKYVIANNLEFVPFKDLSHLNLSNEQKSLMQDILAKRNSANITRQFN